jgi:hypothetical protein
MLRAVRDHIADCLETLPMLLEGDLPEASLHTFMGNLGNMRKAIFPSLLDAYDDWLQGNALPLNELPARAAHHWEVVAEQALDLYREQSPDLAARIARLVDARHC